MLDSGDGVAQSQGEAERLFLKAAEQGMTHDLFYLHLVSRLAAVCLCFQGHMTWSELRAVGRGQLNAGPAALAAIYFNA